MKRLSIVLFAVVLILAATSLVAAPKELTILWAQWDPADYLQQLVKEYSGATREGRPGALGLVRRPVLHRHGGKWDRVGHGHR